MKKIGFIVNPLAGIGAKVGLKGSDGRETVQKAFDLGANPESELKASSAISELAEVKEKVTIYTASKNMGEDICKNLKLNYEVVYEYDKRLSDETDTENALSNILKQDINLLVFAGGDGTARNILDSIDLDIPVIGIPSGCKIHSGVYALNPKKAGELLKNYVCGKHYEKVKAEVMDIDEELFRNNIVEAKLYGYLNILKEKKYMQNLKSGSSYDGDSTKGLSMYIAESIKTDTLYIIGTGSTTADIMHELGIENNTLLGVDLIYNNKLIKKDCTEKDILNIIDKYDNKKIIVTVIGGQGYVFGRGNQQISAKVIEKVGKENIIIAASKNKMLELVGKSLYADTGDEKINEYLKGYYRITVGYKEEMMAKIDN